MNSGTSQVYITRKRSSLVKMEKRWESLWLTLALCFVQIGHTPATLAVTCFWWTNNIKSCATLFATIQSLLNKETTSLTGSMLRCASGKKMRKLCGRQQPYIIRCGPNGTPTLQILFQTICHFFRNINLTCIWTATSMLSRMLTMLMIWYLENLRKNNFSCNMQLKDIFTTLSYKSISVRATRNLSLENQVSDIWLTRKVLHYIK